MSERVKACKYSFFSLKIKCQAFANPQCHCDEMKLWINITIRDLQIRLRQRLRVRVFQCVPDAHARLCDAVTSTRSVFKISRRRPDANYEIFDKSRPPTTSSLQVQRRVKRLVFKGADTL